MTPTGICIVARPMSPTRIQRGFVVCAIAGLVGVLGGCESLDGRKRNREGNKLFKESQFAGAAGQYEKALTEVDDPIIHFNLGLAYAKIFKPGYDKPVTLEVAGSLACTSIPGTKEMSARVCVKEGDTHFNECDDKNVCPSSFHCEPTKLCTIDDKALAELAAKHFSVWIAVQPSDEEIKKQLAVLDKELAEVVARDCGASQSEHDMTSCASPNVIAVKTRIEELAAKDQIRKQLTQLYIDSDQFDKALAYWESLLKERPNDPEIMGNLAGINLKANNWRKSIDWYTKVAGVAKDNSDKVAAYQFIGNVAWSKLNSKQLSVADSIELSDRGISALQHAAELSPKTPKLYGLLGSIYNFRAQLHGASWAAGIDRASAQDLQHQSRVLTDEAKKAQGLDPTHPPMAPTPPAAPGGATATKTGG